jgi:hypothetical protein
MKKFDVNLFILSSQLRDNGLHKMADKVDYSLINKFAAGFGDVHQSERQEADVKDFEIKVIRECQEAKDWLIQRWSEISPYQKIAEIKGKNAQSLYAKYKDKIISLISQIKLNLVTPDNANYDSAHFANAAGWFNPADAKNFYFKIDDTTINKVKPKEICVHEITHSIYAYLTSENIIDPPAYQSFLKSPINMIEQDLKTKVDEMERYTLSPEEQVARISEIRSSMNWGQFISKQDFLGLLTKENIRYSFSEKINQLSSSKDRYLKIYINDFSKNHPTLSAILKAFTIKCFNEGGNLVWLVDLDEVVKMFNQVARQEDQQDTKTV